MASKVNIKAVKLPCTGARIFLYNKFFSTKGIYNITTKISPSFILSTTTHRNVLFHTSSLLQFRNLFLFLLMYQIPLHSLKQPIKIHNIVFRLFLELFNSTTCTYIKFDHLSLIPQSCYVDGRVIRYSKAFSLSLLAAWRQSIILFSLKPYSLNFFTSSRNSTACKHKAFYWVVRNLTMSSLQLWSHYSLEHWPDQCVVLLSKHLNLILTLYTQAPVIQRGNDSVQWINCYPADRC